ncbi:hypothetical protein SmJEL517_g02291 [Synchytrium microbalum]|uniref:S1 motif domain-containing protein n=1 Tax=Synchytrium microbalum TaxID=1806994 RepID=A0A507C286_9FUNG|nr:uncharacterized protein SmJEL517_g02291 [Synchytrium microbalum]TPX35237.1 hypothetical protein SmJEL517_g02291 [Synchytrium microbalum]
MQADICFPGAEIAHELEAQSGPGTYVRNQIVYSSLLGQKQITSNPIHKPIVSVTRNRETSIVPDVGFTVIGRVVRLKPQEAVVDIVVVNGRTTAEGFQGIIRKQDIRAAEKDKVQVHNAEVISLGDAKSYFLSTAKNEFGVLLATSIAGYMMVPVSWDSMMCPVTKAKEFRKCAKPSQ